MYTTYFGLTEAPFRATPDPRFFYPNAAYREAYASLLYGVVQRKGFIALTGEVGTGKTTLLRRLMDELGPPVRFVLFYNTTLTFDETVEFICGELGLAVATLSRVQRLQRLNDLLITEAAQGGNVVLLIDEAQNLGPDVLENLRLISNLETSTAKLLQIVLAGQPELDAKLADPALRQVAQRIAVRYRLEPLSDGEVAAFIDYRLRRCGRTRGDLFTASAVRRIAAYSRRVPRLINALCDGALLATYGAGLTRVSGAMVDEVAAYLRLARPVRPTPAARGLRWAAGGLAAFALGGAAAVLVPGSPLPAALGGVSMSPGSQPAAGTRPGLADDAPAPAGTPPPPSPSPPPGRRPDREPPAAQGPGDGSRTVVERGSSVSEVVSRRYGRDYLLGLDLVKEANPHVADLDRVAAGEALWLPALTPQALARRQPDGSYRMVVAALATPQAATALAERLRRRGYTVLVATREVNATLRLHRVLVEHLDDPAAVGRTWTAARQLDAGSRGWTATVRERGR